MSQLNSILFAEAPFQIIDGDRGKNYPKQGEFTATGHCLFLSATNVTKTGFDFSACQFVDEKRDAALNKGKLQREDIVLTTRGTIGNTAYFNDAVPLDHLRINSGMVILRCDRTKLLPSFLYHFVRSPDFFSQVNGLRSGVAQPQLPIRDMRQIRLPLPPLPTQQRIAGILSAYDELIENSQRRIKILEAMARALYREWFVHFRFPGFENHPRVASALGEIPQGWEVKKIGDISSYINRGITPIYDEDGSSTVINQKCIREQRISLEPARRQSKVISDEKMVRFGDVLINSTGVGTLGRVAQVYELLEKCTVDTHVTIARASAEIDIDFFGCTLLSLQETFERLGIGATGQTELGRVAIAGIDLAVPPLSQQKMFGDAVRGLRLSAVTHGKQIQNLRRTRDLLLPRLLSGQINVEAAN